MQALRTQGDESELSLLPQMRPLRIYPQDRQMERWMESGLSWMPTQGYRLIREAIATKSIA
jgi:hypothetical protein